MLQAASLVRRRRARRKRLLPNGPRQLVGRIMRRTALLDKGFHPMAAFQGLPDFFDPGPIHFLAGPAPPSICHIRSITRLHIAMLPFIFVSGFCADSSDDYR
jgi:hypothetical protein